MNTVIISGRLTKDPVIASTSSGITTAAFTVAIDRGKKKDGESAGTDYPRVKAFGKTAEAIEKYFHKGDGITVDGRIQTGSYKKDGNTVYTTDVIADRIEFPIVRKNDGFNADGSEPVPEGFSATDEDIPF